MQVLKTKRDHVKEYNGHPVEELKDHAVVQAPDGELLIVKRSELHTFKAAKFYVSTDRAHLKAFDGKAVTVLRPIRPADMGYSDTVPQFAVETDDGNQTTVQAGELVDKLPQFDGTIHTQRPEAEQHNGKHVTVVGLVPPSHEDFDADTPHYLVRDGAPDDKDAEKFAVKANEVVPDEVDEDHEGDVSDDPREEPDDADTDQDHALRQRDLRRRPNMTPPPNKKGSDLGGVDGDTPQK